MPKSISISFLEGHARLLPRARNPRAGQLSGSVNSQGHDASLQLSILAVPTGVLSHVKFWQSRCVGEWRD